MKKIFIIMILAISFSLCFAGDLVASSHDFEVVQVYLNAGIYHVTVDGYLSFTLPYNEYNLYIPYAEIKTLGGVTVHSQHGNYNTLIYWPNNPPTYHMQSMSSFEITTAGTYNFKAGYLAIDQTIVHSTTGYLYIDAHSNKPPAGH